MYGDVSWRLPFGKHRGKLIEDVPPDYLAWVLRNCESIDLFLRAAIRAHLEGRTYQDGYRDGLAARGPSSVARLPDLEPIRRRLALRYHPDRGGTTLAMQAVSATLDAVQEACR